MCHFFGKSESWDMMGILNTSFFSCYVCFGVRQKRLSMNTHIVRFARVIAFGVLCCAWLTSQADAAEVEFGDIRGPSQNRVDIITLGDGYQEHELDLYAQHVDGMIDYMFQQEPFNRYEEFFNVYRINTISNESGADVPFGAAPETVDTALGSTYYFDGQTERLLYIDEFQTNTVVFNSLLPLLSSGFLGPEMQFVSVNSERHGGAGGAFAVFAGANEEAYEIAVHEIAHSFAPLQDEYSLPRFEVAEDGSLVRVPNVYTGEASFAEQFANITTDPEGTKWSHWIGHEQPGIGTIGVYEGGLYHEEGIYRPSEDSKLRTLGQPFDAVAREQLVLGIYQHLDPLDSFSDDAQVMADNAISVDPIDPEVIDLEWFVDGQLIEGFSEATLELSQLSAFGFEDGTYEISVVAQDNTDWVRIRQDELRQEVTWENVEFVSESEPVLVDIDTLTQAIIVGNTDTAFDLNSDGTVDALDRDLWLEANGTLSGDADLDGTVAFPDFLALSANFGSDNATWSEGNFNFDTNVNFEDFLLLSQSFGSSVGTSASGEAANVPEPSAAALVGFGVAMLSTLRRRRRKAAV